MRSPQARATGTASHVVRVPRTCVWEVTTACNLRCLHCEVPGGDARPEELTTDEMLAVADCLADAGCTNASLTGGEPLVRSDWPVVARRLADRGIQVKVVTNGTLVNDRAVERMVEAGVSGVAVSIDGLRQEHDELRVPAARMGSRWDKAVEAIETIVKSPLRSAVITQIHRRNVADLEAIHGMLAALGVEVWQVQLSYPLGRVLGMSAPYVVDPSMLPGIQRTLARLAGRGKPRVVVGDNIGYYGPEEPILRTGPGGTRTFWTGCMAGCLGVCVCSNGDVKGCPTHPDEFVVGNVRREAFASIWADEGRFSYNTRWDEHLLAGQCALCGFRRVCRAGCTSMAYALTGTIWDNPCCGLRAKQ